MPTNTVAAAKMREGSGKHWTAEELQAREAAEAEMRRTVRPSLRAPEWMSDDAREVWESVKRKLKGIEMLDNLDAELLAVYCDAVVHYRNASRALNLVDENGLSTATVDQVKAAQAWARIVAAYADRLGLSPGARARLAKKRAEKTVDEFGETFGG
jgi:P27 family predicted phage terminase small subunit